MASRKLEINHVARNYRKLVAAATDDQVLLAETWYDDAREAAREVADNLSTTLDVGAAIVAAYSPLCTWGDNKNRALRYSRGEDVGGVYASNIKLLEIRLRGTAALTGLKVAAFARAILGDPAAVTIDTWMFRAAWTIREAGRLAPTARDVTICIDALNRVANQSNMSPRDCQALIWIVARGSHE
jgi:hypothetical protein